MFSQVTPKFQLPEFGLFRWNVPENRLVADEVYASIYGLSADKLAKGIEIEEVIGLIFKDDREMCGSFNACFHSSGKAWND